VPVDLSIVKILIQKNLMATLKRNIKFKLKIIKIIFKPKDGEFSALSKHTKIIENDPVIDEL
jgi:hypothetical protein